MLASELIKQLQEFIIKNGDKLVNINTTPRSLIIDFSEYKEAFKFDTI